MMKLWVYDKVYDFRHNLLVVEFIESFTEINDFTKKIMYGHLVVMRAFMVKLRWNSLEKF